MKYKILNCVLAAISFIIFDLNAYSGEDLLINAALEKCHHGLHSSPNSDYSVFVFCDDALGTNIGVILSRQGVHPADSKQPNLWGTTKRFWQESAWATDVQEILWSPSGNYLYVTTSGIYGDGGFFELDLKKKKSSRLFPGNQKGRKKGSIFFTKIESFNFDMGKAEVGLYQVETNERISKIFISIKK